MDPQLTGKHEDFLYDITEHKIMFLNKTENTKITTKGS